MLSISFRHKHLDFKGIDYGASENVSDFDSCYVVLCCVSISLALRCGKEKDCKKVEWHLNEKAKTQKVAKREVNINQFCDKNRKRLHGSNVK